ncbi:MFS transporter [Allokutzneria albata]|uniref:Predicted arabinose efflux permease, MFS family n=1 Tax=Allokutzneria albata TaxID=211114 RepID=A0A1G9USX8_ALLAB|nr:MFS transporter [Allokutzneria albata]SDM62907.1 Predicted arabinose efflux permease, MFS family [Allokutzneria albata]
MLEALRLRDFRLLWGARLVAALGSWLLVIAIPAHVFQITGSMLATGLTLVAEFLPPLVLGPFAGALADRWDRRRVMICADLFRAAVISLMLFATTEQTLWLVYVALIAESAGSTVFRPAAQAHTPAVVGTGSALSGAQSLNAAGDGIVRLVGPPAGAALLTVAGFEFLVLLDSASYLISALAITATAPRPHPPGSRAAVRAGIAGILPVLRGVPIALAFLPFTAIFLAANASLSALLVPFGVRQLGGSEQIGFVSSALGLGFLLGAVIIRHCADRFQPGHLFAASQFATAIAFFVLFSSATMTVALPAAVAIGAFGSMTVVVPQLTLQRVVPAEALGRISAVFLSAEAMATLLGALVGPMLAEGFSLRTAMVVACVTTALSALASSVSIPQPAMVETVSR